MKKGSLIIVFLICLFSFETAYAQTWNEWFRQGKTQRKYLIQQIVALQGYIEQLKKGIEIGRKGLNLIQGFKEGEFGLHDLFFKSLKKINPNIKNYTRIADIIAAQIYIAKKAKKVYKVSIASNQFRKEELDFILQISNELYLESSKFVNELINIITNGNLQMNDYERLKRIDELYNRTSMLKQDFDGFEINVRKLAAMRMSGSGELQGLKRLYGIDND